MKSWLLVALSFGSLSCAGTEPAAGGAQAPVAAPVLVDLTPPRASAAPKPATPPAQAKSPEEFGMIGLISSGGGDPNAPTAPWGQDDADAGAKGNMWGDSIGDSFGAGGLGLSGVGADGKGGGIGLGGIGTLGHGKSHKGAKLRMGATTVNGRLPVEVIQRIVRQNFGRFRLCYETALQAKPKLAGTIAVTFVIDESGAVSSVGTGAGTAMTDAKLVACVTRSFSNLSFPQPESGKVSVVYPITFSPPEQPAPAAPAATP